MTSVSRAGWKLLCSTYMHGSACTHTYSREPQGLRHCTYVWGPAPLYICVGACAVVHMYGGLRMSSVMLRRAWFLQRVRLRVLCFVCFRHHI